MSALPTTHPRVYAMLREVGFGEKASNFIMSDARRGYQEAIDSIWYLRRLVNNKKNLLEGQGLHLVVVSRRAS
jgi:hypothetical protein